MKEICTNRDKKGSLSSKFINNDATHETQNK